MFPGTLAGDGFQLRALDSTDAAAMYAYLQRPEVFEATSSSGWTYAAVEEFIRSNVEGMAQGRWCRYAIVPDGQTRAFGDIGFGAMDLQHRRAEVGYHLSPEYWGRGLMVKAVATLNAWAFEAGFHRVEATVMDGNRRSERVLEKAGFEREGRMKDYKLVRGEWRDFSLWGLVTPPSGAPPRT